MSVFKNIYFVLFWPHQNQIFKVVATQPEPQTDLKQIQKEQWRICYEIK